MAYGAYQPIWTSTLNMTNAIDVSPRFRPLKTRIAQSHFVSVFIQDSGLLFPSSWLFELDRRRLHRTDNIQRVLAQDSSARQLCVSAGRDWAFLWPPFDVCARVCGICKLNRVSMLVEISLLARLKIYSLL